MLKLRATQPTAAKRAGEVFWASSLEFPAATAVGTPALIMLLTALSNVSEAPPPRDIDATPLMLFAWTSLITKSHPAMRGKV